ncbi:MAG: hypothetical protein O9331_13110, partial [Acidovorax sp.]|nr:hypothetical protein [Acidovorax sp.]
VRAEPVEARATACAALRQAQGERAGVHHQPRTSAPLTHTVRAEPVEATAIHLIKNAPSA